jgi:acyl-CoA thioester hydrolase
MKPFVWKIRVYMEDTDAGGVVYHSRYANIFERVRTEWLRSLGFNQAELAMEKNVIFVIRHMEIDFIRAARLDDELDVTVHSVAIEGVKMMFDQRMARHRDGREIAAARLTAVCVQADTFKPTRVPDWIRVKTGTEKG